MRPDGYEIYNDIMWGTDMSLNEIKDGMAKSLFDMTRTEAWDAGICVQCRMPAQSRCHTSAGIREYRISGLCEICYDAMFEEPEDE